MTGLKDADSGTQRIRSHVPTMNEREQMSGYRLVEMSGGFGRSEATRDGKGREHAAARLILDLRAQPRGSIAGKRGPRCRTH